MKEQTYDFDLHGIVGIRLVDATRADLATVTRQLGPLRGDLDGEPDITVRFTDRATALPLTHVGVADCGFNDEGFFVVRGRYGATSRARIPFAEVGRGPEVVCERALPQVPHLLALVNLTALAKGVLPLHASAFTLDGLGVLVTGWAKSGKTETLLAAVDRGASYVGDEWVYLRPDGEMFGVPEPMRVWDWHLDQQPRLLAGRPRRDRARLAAWRGLAALGATAATTSLPGSGPARKAAPVLARQAYLQVPPEELFGAHRIRLRGHLDTAVLVMSHEDGAIVTRDAGPAEISRRMASSLADERSAFLAHYRQFRYAFPDLASPAVDNAGRREARLLAALFDDRPAAVVAHPYPCDIASLGEAVLGAARRVTGRGSIRGEGEAS